MGQINTDTCGRFCVDCFYCEELRENKKVRGEMTDAFIERHCCHPFVVERDIVTGGLLPFPLSRYVRQDPTRCGMSGKWHTPALEKYLQTAGD